VRAAIDCLLTRNCKIKAPLAPSLFFLPGDGGRHSCASVYLTQKRLQSFDAGLAPVAIVMGILKLRSAGR